MIFSRRDFVRSGAAIAAGACLPGFIRPTVRAAALEQEHLKIKDIKRTTVKVPYRKIPERNMARELPHWKYSEIVQVTLKSGHVGFGETLLYYTWGVTEDEHVKQAMGKNAAEIMWNDDLGAGLQIALFDAVGRAMDVPVHALLGRQVHKQTPLSWWNIDTSAEDMAAECKEAQRQGYMAYKTKGRPWFDIWKQLELSTKGVPPEFKIDMDFNETLLTAQRGLPILHDLEKYPQVDIFETPIPQWDLQGNRAICASTHVKIAFHYGKPDPILAIREDACDGFIVGKGASQAIRDGAVCAAADKPFWLQLVGTGITAAWSLHFGGVLSHSTWPAVNCHQLYEHQLLTKPIEVKNGFSQVPDAPGLGFELDLDAVEKYKVDKPARRPDPPRLIETSWPNGRKVYYGNTGQVNFVLNPARFGKTPYFEPGASTKLVPNDGSTAWKKLYERARKGPLIIPA